MNRTTVMLPAELKMRSKNRASELGVSFGEFVRTALSAMLNSKKAKSKKKDPLFEWQMWHGPSPTDGSANLDEYLYQGFLEEKANWSKKEK